MRGPVRTVLFGLTDPRQAAEVGALGVDAAVIAVGGGSACAVSAGAAQEVSAAFPPLMVRLALLPCGGALPAGFPAAVTGPADPRPAGASARLVRVSHDVVDAVRVPLDADGLWIPPAPAGTSTATRFDFAHVAKIARARRVILEVPDGAAGVETAIRLGQPYAVLFGDAVWFRAGIIDLDLLERALAVVARLNKAAFEL